MISLFNNKKDNNKPEPNSFLENEKSVFETESSNDTSFNENVDYDSLIYQPPVYDTPSYKAQNMQNVGIIVNKNELGFDENALNSGINTIDFKKYDEKPEPLIETIDEITFNEEIPEQLEIINFDESNSDNKKIEETVLKQENDEEARFSIFGADNVPVETKFYSAEQNIATEHPQKLNNTNVKFTEDGNKICPNCSTILNPEAPICFMCSYSFISKDNR